MKDYDELCEALLVVFHWNRQGPMLLSWAMEEEIMNEEPTTLFRGVSLAATLVSKYLRMKVK